ncbi:MAG: helix-turn-helix transcriptional regulator, partial [Magnetococcus sp. YQC-5]
WRLCSIINRSLSVTESRNHGQFCLKSRGYEKTYPCKMHEGGATVGCRPSVTHGKTGDSVPWREVLIDVAGQEVGLSLAGARHKEGLTQRHLSLMTGIPKRHIAAMETGKRPIGEQNALILANALNVDYRIFL